MNAYVSKAVFGKLPHKLVFAVMPERDLNVLQKRGLHGVPMKSLKDMNKRMTKMLKKGCPSIRAVMKAGGFSRPPPRDLVSREVSYTGLLMPICVPWFHQTFGCLVISHFYGPKDTKQSAAVFHECFRKANAQQFDQYPLHFEVPTA